MMDGLHAILVFPLKGTSEAGYLRRIMRRRGQLRDQATAGARIRELK